MIESSIHQITHFVSSDWVVFFYNHLSNNIKPTGGVKKSGKKNSIFFGKLRSYKGKTGSFLGGGGGGEGEKDIHHTAEIWGFILLVIFLCLWFHGNIYLALNLPHLSSNFNERTEKQNDCQDRQKEKTCIIINVYRHERVNTEQLLFFCILISHKKKQTFF